MSDTQLQSVERTILGLAAFGLAAYLLSITHGAVDFPAVLAVMGGLLGAVSGYWFGQASK